MKKTTSLFYALPALILFISCDQKNKTTTPTQEAISAIDLKRGPVVVCGPPEQQLGSVAFETSCSGIVKKDFNLALALLHSFEYDEAEKVFSKIIDEAPDCAMAYWGVAMSNYHQVWPSPPSPEELEKGNKAIAVAQSIAQKTKRETDYINAIGVFYKDWKTIPHRSRSNLFQQAMEKVYKSYPDDKEAAIFYALSLDGAADPTDKNFTNQKKAGAILTALYPGEPNHPGVVHYIIHSYDYPELAHLALDAARKYASIAPSSAHAQHMPSHVFTRLGLWDECIQSNLASVASAKCYAESAGIKGHWDEELHGLDYLVYAYLQKGENKLAEEQLNYLHTIKEVSPPSFKVAYAFAAIPSRYLLENKKWKEASDLTFYPENFPWQKFPWQRAIVHFARLLGSANIGRLDAAKIELQKLQVIYDTLVAQNDSYKAGLVQIQIKTSEAWILFNEGKNVEALQQMQLAAEMEDKTEKSPVTPGEVLPARELLADMFLQMKKTTDAQREYEADLKKHPNRFNSLYGAGFASEKINDIKKATFYYQKLLAIAPIKNSDRPELKAAQSFLNTHR